MTDRRKFIRNMVLTGVGMGIADKISAHAVWHGMAKGKRIGLIGLDTGHCAAFTRSINGSPGDFNGYTITAAYPKGTEHIIEWKERIPQITEEVKQYGVEIVDSIPALLKQVDAVILTCIDGNKHLEQALPVLKAGKPLFIDKPVSASLADTIAIFEAAKHYKTPVFSCSSLRYMASVQEVVKGKIGNVIGAEAYSPAVIEKTHPDFFWYGIHGIEILYAVMGAGCEKLSRTHTAGTDVVVGVWKDGRIGTFRGTRTGTHSYGGIAYGEKGDAFLGPYDGYEPMLKVVTLFFDNGQPPIEEEVTKEICAFMEAADKSKSLGGKQVSLDEIWSRGRAKASKKLKAII
ncbi:Gfo/Idh/MocA family oxidoreductase [Agriterribacter sp.]|uniref:Gfo/Idh/MocA family protein n=1 Tax=Agriterribacter sp. TaxID=2821509 RepID=UPI002C037AFD|nr:Gfo/Idh/MocA family oxidoreductase [Agriterribacter sp.]HRP54436.1 Gfo/Idh/MocA family oxidoreductase [Agriterribacter sp.]